MKNQVVGYITSNPLRTGFIPHQIQNLMIRNFVEGLNHEFLLSWTEYKDMQPLVCNSLLSEAFYDGVCFYSLEQLLDFPDGHAYLLNLKVKNIWVGFARENVFFTGDDGFESTMKLWWLMKVTSASEPKFSANGRNLNLITANHVKTSRDYRARATAEKPRLAKIAKQFGFDYWDGDRNTGYGGYKNDGRWGPIAEKLIHTYSLQDGHRVLDIGCGKGYLISELKNKLPGLNLTGIDISDYALQNASSDISGLLKVMSAENMDFNASQFDLVISLNTLHNLQLPQLFQALEKIQEIGKNAFICVESYRNEQEKWNLMQWQLTCEAFFTPEEWTWIFKKAGYTGDYEFIFFE